MFRRPASTVTALVLATASVLPAAAQPAPIPGPAVKKVVLYKHGVGYFERQGEVDGNATLELSFKASQMKDMLKSLFALDLGGGRIANILYDSKDPLSKQLESVLIDVPPQAALTELAMRLKGAKVEVVVGTRTIQGSVLGIDRFAERTDNDTVMKDVYKLLLVNEPDGIQPVNLLDVSSLKLLDDPLQKDLKRILEAYLKSKYADRKTVLLRAEGNGARPIKIGYIVETPIWKTSYRMLFEEGQTPYLQGWAIAENATDDDWTDVKMTFVAGAPISFSMDLYTSYYPHRQTIGLPTLGATGYAAAALEGDGESTLTAGGAVLAHDEAMNDKMERSEGKKAMRMLQRGGPAGGAPAAAPAAPPPPMAELAAASMQPMAQGVKVGDLFAYEGKGLVTIPRGKAALVPILGEKLDGANRILYYKRELSAHPAHACFFKNATDLTLESGPVTFFDGSTCVGEGVLSKALQSGMHEIVPFALETGCTVEPETQSRPEEVFKSWLAEGVLYMTHAEIYETVYRCANKMKKDFSLVVEHPRAGGFQLIEPAKEEEEIPGHYRFRVELKAGAKAELKVRERNEVTNGVALLQTGPDQIRFYMQQKHLSERAKTFLREVLDLQGQIGRAQQEIQQAEAERQKVREELEETRRNVQVLRDTPDELAMRQRQLRDLEAASGRLKELKAKVEELQARKRDLENQLSRKVREFTDQ